MSPVAVFASRHRAQRGEPLDVVGLIGDAVAPDVSAPETSMHAKITSERTIYRERSYLHAHVAACREDDVRVRLPSRRTGRRRNRIPHGGYRTHTRNPCRR
jgi:hypothetical protein